jgi:hypothetical protein
LKPSVIADSLLISAEAESMMVASRLIRRFCFTRYPQAR